MGQKTSGMGVWDGAAPSTDLICVDRPGDVSYKTPVDTFALVDSAYTKAQSDARYVRLDGGSGSSGEQDIFAESKDSAILTLLFDPTVVDAYAQVTIGQDFFGDNPAVQFAADQTTAYMLMTGNYLADVYTSSDGLYPATYHMALHTLIARLKFLSANIAASGDGVLAELFGETAQDGGGSAILKVNNRVAAPTSAPTGGLFEYAESGAKRVLGSGNTLTVVAPAGDGHGSTNDWQECAGQTVGTATVDLLTFAIPTSTSVAFRVFATLHDSNHVGGSFFLTGNVARGASSPAIDGGTVVLDTLNSALGAATLTLVISGNNVIVRGTGVTSKTINWCASVWPKVYTP